MGAVPRRQDVLRWAQGNGRERERGFGGQSCSQGGLPVVVHVSCSVERAWRLEVAGLAWEGDCDGGALDLCELHLEVRRWGAGVEEGVWDVDAGCGRGNSCG